MERLDAEGLCEAYRAFNKPDYLELALQNAGFTLGNLVTTEGRLSRIYKNPSPSGKGGDGAAFLDDYANIIEAFIALYEVTFDEKWLNKAKELTDVAITQYYDDANGIFFYT